MAQEMPACRGADAPTVTKSDIVAALRRLGIVEGDRLFAHSSLRAFGHVDGAAEAVCDALEEAAGREGTVAVPTFMWGRYHNQEVVTFDIKNDACDLGRIPETLRQRPHAMRDEHVCHSIAAVGKRAAEVLGDGVRPFAEGSGMHRLYTLDFKYLFLGCGFDSCTALHTVEELMRVPYRYYRHYLGSRVIRADGTSIPARAIEFLKYLPYRNDFAKMEAVFASRGALRTTHAGAARLMLAQTRDLVDIGVALLKEDIAYLLSPASRAHLADDAKAKRPGAPIEQAPRSTP